jgi:hypothetical protein
MALGHCLCVSEREASSPAVLAKGKCPAYVAPAASTGAFFRVARESPMAPNAENVSEAAPKGAIVLPLAPCSRLCRQRRPIGNDHHLPGRSAPVRA